MSGTSPLSLVLFVHGAKRGIAATHALVCRLSHVGHACIDPQILVPYAPQLRYLTSISTPEDCDVAVRYAGDAIEIANSRAAFQAAGIGFHKFGARVRLAEEFCWVAAFNTSDSSCNSSANSVSVKAGNSFCMAKIILWHCPMLLLCVAARHHMESAWRKACMLAGNSVEVVMN